MDNINIQNNDVNLQKDNDVNLQRDNDVILIELLHMLYNSAQILDSYQNIESRDVILKIADDYLKYLKTSGIDMNFNYDKNITDDPDVVDYVDKIRNMILEEAD